MTSRKSAPGGGIAARIREARRGAGLTQEALAALVGVTAHAVGDWEAGRRTPTPEHLAGVVLHCKEARAQAAAGARRSPVQVTMPREERMRAVAGAVARHWAEQGYPPTLREVQAETGFSSISVVAYALDWCEEAGLIVRARGIARAITLTEAGRVFAESPPESGGPPPAPREDPAPAATGGGAADAATDASPPPPGGDRKAPIRRGAYAPATRRTAPGSGIGARIGEARRGAGLTQRELAALVGVSPQTIWSWEAGRMKPTWEHRVEVAFHCGTDVGALEERAGPGRDRVGEAVAAFLDAVAHLPDRDVELIWTFIHFRRWLRRRGWRAA